MTARVILDLNIHFDMGALLWRDEHHEVYALFCQLHFFKVNVRVAADALRDVAERGETKAHPGDVEV